MAEKEIYGGQAVIEGVMMKDAKKLAIAVRLLNGKIKIKKETLKKKNKILSIPFVRGVANLIEIMWVGMKAILWSADQQLEKHEKITSREIWFTVITSVLLAIGFFVALPYFLTHLAGINESSQPIMFNVIDGVIKLVLFIGYLLLISQTKDIKRVFQYHGAEHKVIYCYEAGKKLTVENARRFSTLHPRCGTSFLVIVMGISIVVFSIIPYIVNTFGITSFWLQKGILFSSRIIVIPIIAGISYELLKLSARFDKNIFMRVFTFPGLLIQRITTQEPDKKQIDVAIRAFKAVKG